MPNQQGSRVFVSHYAPHILAMLLSAHADLSEALNLVDQAGDLLCGARLQTAIDGLDFALSERLHDND